MATDFYIKNKPLIFSVFLGLLYFLFSWSIDFSEGMKKLFMTTMLFLPGLTFPISTTYFNLGKIKKNEFRIVLHIILSLIIYDGSIWLFSAEGRLKSITIFAGLLGSLSYLITTKLILKKKITGTQIILTSVLSGLTFLPYELIRSESILLGFAILFWTILNGLILNQEYKNSLLPSNSAR